MKVGVRKQVYNLFVCLGLVLCQNIGVKFGAKFVNEHVKKLPYYSSKAVEKVDLKAIEGDKIKGVSLGGWLVLEPWISPSIFESAGDFAVDEYTLNQVLGTNATTVLQNHWDTWITEQDIKDIKGYGLNMVRIPIGYWAFGLLIDDPFVSGQEPYLDKAIEWCAANGLAVQVDIHGMPGSQNGFDNSGRRTNTPFWMNTDETRQLAADVTRYVLEKYGNNPNVAGIEMVNEPFAYQIGAPTLRSYYTQVYETARDLGINTTLYFHDGFLPINAWDDFGLNFKGVPIVMDHHIYEIFTEDQIQLSTDQHIQNVYNIGSQMRAEPHNSIVGEFSGALTDCTKYINGKGTGARYDGTVGGVVVGSCVNHEDYNSWTEEAKAATTNYTRTQMDVYTDNGQGWIFWCYKTESTVEWDFRVASDLGIIPSLTGAQTTPTVSIPGPSATVDTVSIGFSYKGEGGRLSTGNDTSMAMFVVLSSLVFIYLSRS